MSYVEECFTSSRKSEKVNEVRVMEQMESRGDNERVARSLFIQEKDKCHYVRYFGRSTITFPEGTGTFPRYSLGPLLELL